jgi:PAS domain-containing protein
MKVSAEGFLAAVLETTAQPIWVVDRDDVIRFANPAAIEALGYRSADELLHFGAGRRAVAGSRHVSPIRERSGQRGGRSREALGY